MWLESMASGLESPERYAWHREVRCWLRVQLGLWFGVPTRDMTSPGSLGVASTTAFKKYLWVEGRQEGRGRGRREGSGNFRKEEMRKGGREA